MGNGKLELELEVSIERSDLWTNLFASLQPSSARTLFEDLALVLGVFAALSRRLALSTGSRHSPPPLPSPALSFLLLYSPLLSSPPLLPFARSFFTRAESRASEADEFESTALLAASR